MRLITRGVKSKTYNKTLKIIVKTLLNQLATQEALRNFIKSLTRTTNGGPKNQ
jgi:hypothetical protein